MKKLYFLVYKTGESVFGAIIKDLGQCPAFFTDETTASNFFAGKVQDQDEYVFAGSDKADDIRRFILYNEKSYVLLDEVLMTGADMFKHLDDGMSSPPQVAPSV